MLYGKVKRWRSYMSIYIVHTIFPLIMPRRICFDHQELVTLVIISLILMAFTFDSMVIL